MPASHVIPFFFLFFSFTQQLLYWRHTRANWPTRLPGAFERHHREGKQSKLFFCFTFCLFVCLFVRAEAMNNSSGQSIKCTRWPRQERSLVSNLWNVNHNTQCLGVTILFNWLLSILLVFNDANWREISKGQTMSRQRILFITGFIMFICYP